MTPLELGARAPAFSAPSSHGETVRSADLLGAPAVVVFYPYAFTGICTGELAALQARYAGFRAAGARVLAVSTDSMFALRVFGDQQGLTFDLVSDHWPHGAVASAFGVFDADAGCALRGSFVLDPAGVVTWRVLNGIGEARDIGGHLSALQAQLPIG